MAELSVPYKSQWDFDASLARGDCMDTCLAMLLSYLYVTSIRTLAITKLIGGSTRFTSAEALQRVSDDLGVRLNYIHGSGRIEDAEKLIKEGKPFIAIVDYQLADSWREDKSYNGPHAVLVIGAEPSPPPGGDKFYIINDPDHIKPQNKGKQIIPSFIFEKAWGALGFPLLSPDRGRN